MTDTEYIAKVLYDYIYDPWTDGSTIESIKKDMEEKPMDIMYCLCSRLEEYLKN